MASFRIAQGTRASTSRRSYFPGDLVALDRYDPAWGDKFEPVGSEADDLRRVALTLARKVWLRDLATAKVEADRVERESYRSAALASEAQPGDLRETPEPKATPAPEPPRRGPGRPPRAH